MQNNYFGSQGSGFFLDQNYPPQDNKAGGEPNESMMGQSSDNFLAYQDLFVQEMARQYQMQQMQYYRDQTQPPQTENREKPKRSNSNLNRQSEHKPKDHHKQHKSGDEHSKSQPAKVVDLNIWHLSKSFFRTIPSSEKIDRVFQGKRQPAPIDYMDKTTWKEIIAEIIINCQSTNPELAKQMKIPSSIISGVSTEVKVDEDTQDNLFPTETMTSGSLVFHRLVSSIIPIKNQPSRQGKKSTSDTKYFPTPNALLPRLENHKYLALDFETRLKCELDSLGLDTYYVEEPKIRNSFQQEIDNYYKELRSVKSELDTERSAIIQSLPSFRREQKAHQAKIETYKAMVATQNNDNYISPRRKRKL